MAMNNNINEYVGKTFSYIIPAQNILIVVTVTGFEKGGNKYLDDSYVGRCVLIDKDGNTFGDSEEWSHGKESFENMDKQLIRG